jgi:hypothetical protein
MDLLEQSGGGSAVATVRVMGLSSGRTPIARWQLSGSLYSGSDARSHRITLEIDRVSLIFLLCCAPPAFAVAIRARGLRP